MRRRLRESARSAKPAFLIFMSGSLAFPLGTTDRRHARGDPAAGHGEWTTDTPDPGRPRVLFLDKQCEPSMRESALTLTIRLNQCQWLMNAVLPVHCRLTGDSRDSFRLLGIVRVAVTRVVGGHGGRKPVQCSGVGKPFGRVSNGVLDQAPDG